MRVERNARRATPDQIINEIFPRLSLELRDFGWLHTSERGDGIYIGSESGFFHVFENTRDLRGFALNLMEAVADIEHSRSAIIPVAIPEGYETQALSDYESQISVDAWLYRNSDREEKN